MAVTVAVVKETAPNERRVAISPEVVKKLAKLGASVVIQTGAGDPTHQPDSLFGDVAKAADARSALGQADVVFKVAPPTLDEIAAMKEGAIYVGMLAAHTMPERTKALRDRKITAFAVELIPRISRAQSMDGLSSQASLAGYKAVLIAATVPGAEMVCPAPIGSGASS